MHTTTSAEIRGKFGTVISSTGTYISNREHVDRYVIFIFISSVHLYYLFPSLEEGGLATYRTAIVQNQHLAMLAKVYMVIIASCL